MGLSLIDRGKEKVVRNSRTGQAVLLLLLALGIFLMGAVGWAIESSLYYTHRQMAQAAADAAAQAAITSIYARTNIGANVMDGTAFTCTNGSDLRTPCHFARQHGFGLAGSTDVIQVGFPTSIDGVDNLSGDTPATVSVTISRPFNSGVSALLGLVAQQVNVRAQGTAAMVIETSPVPILVMHPDEPEAFHINGNPDIVICGGPPRSIQVNSIDDDSVDIDGNANLIDLSGAGPGGSLLGCNGSGGEFGNHGGPFNFNAAQNGYPGGTLLPATDGAYIKTLPVDDPLALPMPGDPATPATSGSTFTVNGQGVGAPNGCQRPPNRTCTVYRPGVYNSDISINNNMALLLPGLYYIRGGFSIGNNGVVHMAPCTAPDPNTGCGVTIYLKSQNANDVVDIGANAGRIQGNTYSQNLTVTGGTVNCSGNCLQGPPLAAPYWGVVLMADRTTNFAQNHSLGGGGGLTVAGTLYFTSSLQAGKADLAGSNAFQTLSLGGNSGNTSIVGQILVDALDMSGNSEIRMTLNPNAILPIRKLALVR